MGDELEKLDLGNSDYAFFYPAIKHGTQRIVSALTRPFLKFPEGKSPKLTLKGEDQQPVIEGDTEVNVDLAAMDYDAINDAIIVGQVKEWSFGSVNQAILDSLDETTREQLKNECNRLYGTQGPLAKGGDGN